MNLSDGSHIRRLLFCPTPFRSKHTNLTLQLNLCASLNHNHGVLQSLRPSDESGGQLLSTAVFVGRRDYQHRQRHTLQASPRAPAGGYKPIYAVSPTVLLLAASPGQSRTYFKGIIGGGLGIPEASEAGAIVQVDTAIRSGLEDEGSSIAGCLTFYWMGGRWLERHQRPWSTTHSLHHPFDPANLKAI
jgi:hypothetical protein